MKELVDYDDLFTLSYYTTQHAREILGEPDDEGSLTRSHIVILHRDKILDTKFGSVVDAFEHDCKEFHTKRIFRVVPLTHPRGL